MQNHDLEKLTFNIFLTNCFFFNVFTLALFKMLSDNNVNNCLKYKEFDKLTLLLGNILQKFEGYSCYSYFV